MRALGLTVAVVLGVGCANAGSAVANAAISTAVAGGVAAYRRSNGECYTPCTPGTTCNEKTGTCDPLPCRGECKPDERCEQTFSGERCVPDLELEIRGTRTTAPAPAAAPLTPPSLLSDAGAPAPARPLDAPTLEAP